MLQMSILFMQRLFKVFRTEFVMVITKKLNKHLTEQISKLTAICNIYDNDNYKPIYEKKATDITYISEYVNKELISFLSYINYGDYIEISGLTHPEYRGHGIFKRLMSHLPKTDTIYTLGKSMDASRHNYVWSEYLLRLTPENYISQKYNPDDYRIKAHHVEFGTAYTLFNADGKELGHLNTYMQSSIINIWDVYIKEEYRHQGLCRILLDMCYKDFPEHRSVILHVNSVNVYAFKAYKSFGFKVREEIRYYAL